VSRIGRTPVPVPSGVKVALEGRSVTSADRAVLSATRWPGNNRAPRGRGARVERPDDERRSRSCTGLRARSSATWSWA